MLPPCFLPRQMVYGWFTSFHDRGTWQGLNHWLIMLDCERTGREVGPSAAMIDSQSIKTTKVGGPCGHDVGKKVNGRKRHAMVDTDDRQTNGSFPSSSKSKSKSKSESKVR